LKTQTILFLLIILGLASAASQAQVSLTVYQRDLVLVHDDRTVDLQKGDNRIVFTGIAPDLYQPTLRVTPSKDLSDLKTVEINYEYDLVSQDRLWRKYLDKPFEFTKSDSTYKGILRNFDDKTIFLEPEGKPGAISLVERSGVKDMIFEALPQGLALRPEVVWKVRSGQARKNARVEISYLTKGITWQADYAAYVVNDNRVRLTGNLTLSNSLEMDFPDAKLDLIAGSPHRTGDARQLSDEDALSTPQAETKAAGERFFEYRHYSVPGTTSLHGSQSMGLPLIGPVDVTAQRGFFYDGSSGTEEVEIHLTFANRKDAGLGIALPEGDLLLYQADGDGQPQFLGEDQLKSSSPGDEVELVIGKAFDLRVDRNRVDHERIARNRTRDTVQIILASSRDKASKLTIRERLYGFWDITKATWGGKEVTPKVKDANRVEFNVELAPGATDTLNYVVEYGY
jgi:hypothetical protein